MAGPTLEYRSAQDPTTPVHNPEATASAVFAGMLPVLLSLILMTREGMDSPAVFGVWLLLSAAAIAFGRAGRARSKMLGGKGRVRSRLGIAGGVGGLVLLVLGFIIFIGGLNRGIERANRIKCVSNMRNIHRAMALFAKENGGALPQSVGQLLDHIDASAFVCHSSQDKTAVGATTREVAANLLKSDHCSYVYVGAGMTWPVGADVVIAYEESDNHDGEGIHVLFGDGVVKWNSAEEAEQLLKTLKKPASLPVQ